MSQFVRIETHEGIALYINLDQVLWVDEHPTEGRAVVYFANGETINADGAGGKKLIDSLPMVED